jgi:ribosomal protein S6E (S10)
LDQAANSATAGTSPGVNIPQRVAGALEHQMQELVEIAGGVVAEGVAVGKVAPSVQRQRRLEGLARAGFQARRDGPRVRAVTMMCSSSAAAAPWPRWSRWGA